MHVAPQHKNQHPRGEVMIEVNTHHVAFPASRYARHGRYGREVRWLVSKSFRELPCLQIKIPVTLHAIGHKRLRPPRQPSHETMLLVHLLHDAGHCPIPWCDRRDRGTATYHSLFSKGDVAALDDLASQREALICFFNSCDDHEDDALAA